MDTETWRWAVGGLLGVNVLLVVAIYHQITNHLRTQTNLQMRSLRAIFDLIAELHPERAVNITKALSKVINTNGGPVA